MTPAHRPPGSLTPRTLGEVTLHPYQEAGVVAFKDGVRAGHRMQIAFLPTGCGKTTLGLAAALECGRTLWLCHRKELITQPIKQLKRMDDGCEYGIVRAKDDDCYRDGIVFATVQTAHRRLEREWGAPWKLIVVDECQHNLAETYRKILSRWPLCPVLGLTATPIGTDGKGLHDAGYTAFCIRLTLPDAIRYGYLCDYTAQRVVLPEFDPTKLRTQDGDFVASDLAEALERAHAAERSAEAYAKHARGRRGVIFTQSVDQAKRTAEVLSGLGVPAGWVSGEMDEEERDLRLLEHQKGVIHVLANHSVLSEGYDDPALSVCMMARPTRSKKVYVQCVGRVLRKYDADPTKKALILDLVGAHEDVGLVISPRLKKIEKEDEGKEEFVTLAQFGEEDEFGDPEEKKKSGGEDELVDRFLAAATNGLSSMSKDRLRWISCAPGLFALPIEVDGLGVGSKVVLYDRGDGFWAVEEIGWGKRRIVVEAASDDAAQYCAEEWGAKAGAFKLSTERAIWRAQEATSEQLRFLEEFSCFCVEGLSQGEASDILAAARVRRSYSNLVKS